MAIETSSSGEPTPGGEWLFQVDGQVFGPIDPGRLLELLSTGAIGPMTPVSQDGGRWRALEDFPELRVVLEKAQARARVEADVAVARRRARWRGALRLSGAVAIVATLAVAGTRAAAFLAGERPWRARSALLDDFSAPVAVGTVLVSRSPRPLEDEVMIPADAVDDAPRGSSSGEPRPRRVAAVPDASGRAGAVAAMAGGAVLAKYDPARIEEVVAQRQSSLASCVRDEARRTPELRGEVPIEFAVGNDGRVSALWIHDPRYRSGTLRDCMLRRLQEWTFDRFEGERPVVSLAFRVGAR